MSVSKVLLSSNSDEWATPIDVYASLDNEFHFTLDACATEENYKCDRYFTKEQDALKQDWAGETVFCNPPYSEIGRWVEKAYREGCKDNTLVCLLIPARTDTRYFHNFIYQRSEIRFINGRLRFNDSKSNAPFPSIVVIFRGPYWQTKEKQNEITISKKENGCCL